MEDVKTLRKKIGEILRKEISDYMPTITEESIIIQDSVLERSSIMDINTDEHEINYIKSISNEDYGSINYQDSLEYAEFVSSKSVDLNRSARLINNLEASQFFKQSQELNSIL